MARFDGEYVMIRNIPKHFSCKFVRHFFEDFIESEGFVMFHFLRRQDLPKLMSSVEKEERNAACFSNSCIVKVERHRLQELFEIYDKKEWLFNSEPTLCFIDHFVPIKLSKNENFDIVYILGEEKFSSNYLSSLPEMNPPSYIPHGNIGTKKSYLISKIETKQLPMFYMFKLGLHFNPDKARPSRGRRHPHPMRRNKKTESYGAYKDDGKHNNRRRDDLKVEQCDRSETEANHLLEFAAFEKYSKGIGRKVLEASGWQQGQGVGRECAGIAEPLPLLGQTPTSKKGFGFVGRGRQPPRPRDREVKWESGGCLFG